MVKLYSQAQTSCQCADEEQLDCHCSTGEEANECFTLLWETGSGLSQCVCVHANVSSCFHIFMRTSLNANRKKLSEPFKVTHDVINLYY